MIAVRCNCCDNNMDILDADNESVYTEAMSPNRCQTCRVQPNDPGSSFVDVILGPPKDFCRFSRPIDNLQEIRTQLQIDAPDCCKEHCFEYLSFLLSLKPTEELLICSAILALVD